MAYITSATNCMKCGKSIPLISSATIAYCGDCLDNVFPIITTFPKDEPQERHYKTHQRAQDSAFNNQVGGDHYTKLAIQPMEYSFKNKLDPCQHTAIKYITRFRDKGGRQDLEKAIDCIQMLIEMEYRA